jgi:tetratricopeptide (TPR) repeat protein
MILRVSLLFISLILLACNAVGQNVDSFVNPTKTDHALNIAMAAIEKTNELLDEGNLDQALAFSETAFELCESANYLKGISSILYTRGVICRIKGDYANSLNNFYKAIEYYQLYNDIRGKGKALNQIGAIYRIQGNYPGAIDYLLEALNIFQSTADSSGTASVLNNIGIVYFYQNDYEKALEFYTESLHLEELMKDEWGISVSYINIGEIYKKMKRYNESLEYYLKALELALKYQEKDEDNDGVGILYNEIGSIYMQLGDFSLSMDYLEKALKIFKEIDSKYRIAECKLYMGELHLILGHISKAKKCFMIALENAKMINSTDLTSSSHKMLHIVYETLKDTGKAYYHYKRHIASRDSLYNEDNTRKMTQAAMLYDFEKQTRNIQIEQAKKDAVANEIMRRQDLLRNFLFVGFSFFGVLAFLIYLGYRHKKKSNVIITENNALLEMANEEIMTQKHEIESQRDLVVNQKALIEGQKKRMDDSILYARHIQSAVILSEKLAINLFDDYFVLFRPKEIVSGDFYWATNINGYTIAAVADCTGHGVPGAFMSMLGVSFLNEIVRKREIVEPALILEELRKVLIEALVLNSEQDMKREGMYVNIISINAEKNECVWAGARTPIWIIRNNKDYAGELVEELKPDNPSVAMHKKKRVFVSHKINVQKGDRIYLFSDGIADQFGGSEGRKFSFMQLKQIIIDNAGKSLAVQKISIEEALDNWQNPNTGEMFEQVDDITIFGIRI